MTRFEKTVKMSTYLLAFVVSDFEFKEKSTPTNGVKFRVWARPNAIDRVDYALDIGVKVIAPSMVKFRVWARPNAIDRVDYALDIGVKVRPNAIDRVDYALDIGVKVSATNRQ